MAHSSTRVALLAALALGSCPFASCSGGGGGSSGPQNRFGIVAINLTNGASWPINRPIEITFTEAVDPDSVDLNAIRVREVGGGPAVGEFTLQDGGTKVVFQPRCPANPDFADSGLAFGPTASGLPHRFELVVLAGNAPENVTVRSADGEALRTGASLEFTTPLAQSGSALFWDPAFGPPRARVLGDQEDTDVHNSSRLEIGANATAHVFRRDNGVLSLDPPLEVPLNTFAALETSVVFVIEIDQPIDPSAANLAPSHVRLEYRDHAGAWHALASQPEIARNCSSSGATLRLTPLGLLPPASDIRAVLTSQFRDLSGATSFTAQDNFAVASTRPLAGELVDALVEDFDTNAREDDLAVFAEPRARWSDGGVGARFDFSGGGGPGGNFDLKVSAGEILLFNTCNRT